MTAVIVTFDDQTSVEIERNTNVAAVAIEGAMIAVLRDYAESEVQTVEVVA